MPTLSTFCKGMFYNGGLVAGGAFLVALNRWECLPRYTYPLSYGLLAVGTVGVYLRFRRENGSCTAAENLKDDLNLAKDEKASTETPKSVKQGGIARRIFISQVMEETDKVLEHISKVARLDSSKTRPKNSERIFINLSDLPHVNENAPDGASELSRNISDTLGKNNLAVVEVVGISLPTSPLKLEMLDIEIKNSEINKTENTLTENTKDIVNDMQVGEIPPSIDSDKKK